MPFLGVSVQIVIGAASRAAEHVDQDPVHFAISEISDGYILLALLKSGMMMALFIDIDTLLGSVRFEIMESVPSLNQLILNGELNKLIPKASP